MIIFKKIRFKNLLSFGNHFTEIDLQDKHLLITGKNGSGKSSALCDSLSFALFGKPFRKINKPDLVNVTNKKDCLVEIDLESESDSFMIRRGLNPSIFEIYKNDQLINQNSFQKDYQSFLETNILGNIDHQSFNQIVILGKATYIPFLRLPLDSRRKFIENILEMNIFSIMNEITKIKFTESKNNLKDLKNQLSLLKDKQIFLKSHSKSVEKIQKKNSDKRDQIIRINETIKDLESQIIEFSEDEFEHYSLRQKKLNGFKMKSEIKIDDCKSKLQFFEANNICSQCERDIDDNEKSEMSRKLGVKLDILMRTFNDISKSLDECHEKIAALNKVIKLNFETNAKINMQREILKQISSDDDVQDDHVDYNKTMKDLEKSVEKIESKLEDESKLNKNLKIIIELLKDSGLKSIVMKKYRIIIQSIINQYFKLMGFPGRIEFDENLQESIFMRGQRYPYNNLSEGQKMRIDLSIMMGWRELIQQRKGKYINLMIFDEILDSSLDVGGVHSFIDLLKSLENQSSVIITHSPEKWVDRFSDHIEIEMKNGFSAISEIG